MVKNLLPVQVTQEAAKGRAENAYRGAPHPTSGVHDEAVELRDLWIDTKTPDASESSRAC